MIVPCSKDSTLHASPQKPQQSLDNQLSHQLSKDSHFEVQIEIEGESQKRLDKETLQQNTALVLYNLIKMEKKSSSFVFYGFELDDDDTGPQIDFTQCFSFDNPIHNENLFKYFWKLIDFKYFGSNISSMEQQYQEMYEFFEEAVNKSDKSQILSWLIRKEIEISNSFSKEDLVFWSEVKKTFNKDYLKAEFKIHQHDFDTITLRKADRLNLIQRLELIWRVINCQENENKLLKNCSFLKQQKVIQIAEPLEKYSYQSITKKLNNIMKHNRPFDYPEHSFTSSRSRSSSVLRNFANMNKNAAQKVLQTERNALESVIEEVERNESDENELDEISKQIRKYENQLHESSSINQTMLYKLRASMASVLTGGQPLLPYDNNTLHYQQKINPFQMLYGEMKESLSYRGRCLIDQKEFIQKTVNNLQLQIIAESISKIYKSKKIQDVPQNAILIIQDKQNFMSVEKHWFEIEFQTNLGFPSHQADNRLLIDGDLLLDLNKLRQHSLLTFYNTAFKSRYTYMSHSQVGFNMIYQRPTIDRLQNYKWIAKLAPSEDELVKNIRKVCHPGTKPLKPIQQLMLDSNTRTNVAFQKKNLCHHCRLLCPEEILFACQNTYVFDTLKHQQNRMLGIEKSQPSIKQAYEYDGFYNQGNDFRIFCEDQLTVKNKAKCHRHKCSIKYCRYCINNSYQGQFHEDSICYYCRGQCLCSRCEKHQEMTRLISWYNFLGGDIKKIQYNSNYKKLFVTLSQLKNQQHTQKKENIQMEKVETFMHEDNEKIKAQTNEEINAIIEPKNLLSERILRPHKPINHNPTSYQPKKQPITENRTQEIKQSNELKIITDMSSVINGLRNLSVLCKMTKKREALKLYLIENRTKIFDQKIKHIEEKNKKSFPQSN